MSHYDDVVSEAQALDSEFRAGQLTADEYQELLADLKHIHVINSSALDMANKTRLNEWINGLASAAGLLL